LITTEVVSFIYFLLQQIPSPEKLGWFDQYGPLSVAALAIITNFYFLRMNNKRDMKRDEQDAKKEEANTEALKAIATAIKDSANAIHQNNTGIEVIRTILEQR
jgi:hypothetical protein